MADPVRNPRFRYLDAADLPDTMADLDGIDVRNVGGERLGEVDGFIVDAVSERPYYVVIDSGGWFSGDRYLLPINHASLAHDNRDNEDVLRVNLDKEAIRNYPRFDEDTFTRLDETQLRDFERRTGEACCPDEARRAEAGWSYDRWSHYRQPDWWSTRPSALHEGRAVATGHTEPPAPPRRAVHDPERIIAQEGQPAGDRAQPGDVLGIDTGGEETHLGDTASDEDQRVEDSERAQERWRGQKE